jgi:hypothetical protein
MNLLPTYEQTIAGKRDGIEVPDMADAIWGRIEAVLDVEMPEPTTPAPVQDKPFFKRSAVWIISAGILAIIIALFILLRNEKNTPPPPDNLPQQTVPATKPDTILQQDLKPPDDLPKPTTKKNTKTVVEKHTADTTAHNPFVMAEDSVLKKPPIIIAPPASITVPPLDIKQRPKYGVEVPDSEYLFKIKPKQQ